LVEHKLTLLRDRTTPTKLFRELVAEIAMLMAYEATRDLVCEAVTIDTPLETTPGVRISGKKLTLVPILRAGLGMSRASSAFYRARGSDTSACIATTKRWSRSTTTSACRATGGPDVFLLDPMLATGGSAVSAISSLKRCGATRIRLLALVAAPRAWRSSPGSPGCGDLLRGARPRTQCLGYILPGWAMRAIGCSGRAARTSPAFLQQVAVIRLP